MCTWPQGAKSLAEKKDINQMTRGTHEITSELDAIKGSWYYDLTGDVPVGLALEGWEGGHQVAVGGRPLQPLSRPCSSHSDLQEGPLLKVLCSWAHPELHSNPQQVSMGSRDQHLPHFLVWPFTRVHPVPISAALHLLAPLPKLLFPSQMWAVGPLFLSEASARIVSLQTPLHWHPQPSPSQQSLSVPLTYVTFYIVWTSSSHYTFFFLRFIYLC